MSDCSLADEFGISWWYGLGEFLARRVPVNAHCGGTLDAAVVVPGDGYKLRARAVSPVGVGRPVPSTLWNEQNFKAGFEQPVADHLEAEHRPTECDGVDERRAWHVLDGVRQAGRDQPLSSLRDQVRVLFAVDGTGLRVRLAWWAGPNEVKAIEWEGQRIALVKLEGIVGLRLNIDADNLKARPMQAHASPASAAEQIKCAQLPHVSAPTECSATIPIITRAQPTMHAR